MCISLFGEAHGGTAQDPVSKLLLYVSVATIDALKSGFMNTETPRTSFGLKAKPHHPHHPHIPTKGCWVSWKKFPSLSLSTHSVPLLKDIASHRSWPLPNRGGGGSWVVESPCWSCLPRCMVLSNQARWSFECMVWLDITGKGLKYIAYCCSTLFGVYHGMFYSL